MSTTERSDLMMAAARGFQGFLATGITGLYRKGWDRLRECGFDVDLREPATVENARALLWIAQHRVASAAG